MGRQAVERGEVGDRVAASIREMRLARGWSLTDLSRHLELAGRPILKSGLSKIESGERRVDVDDLAAFCQVFVAKPEALMGSLGEDAYPFETALRLSKASPDDLDAQEVRDHIRHLQTWVGEASLLQYQLLQLLPGPERPAGPDPQVVIERALGALRAAKEGLDPVAPPHTAGGLPGPGIGS